MPVLIKSDKITSLWSYKGRTLRYNEANFNFEDDTIYYQLILASIDSTDKISSNDLFTDLVTIRTCTHCENDTIYCFDSSPPYVQKTGQYKVMALQSQIPEYYIQQFVDEYNKEAIKDVEIEMKNEQSDCHGCTEDCYEEGCKQHKPKLTNGFINIINNKDEVIGKPLEKYINEKHTQEECAGFIDGYDTRKKEEIINNLLAVSEENKKEADALLKKVLDKKKDTLLFSIDDLKRAYNAGHKNDSNAGMRVVRGGELYVETFEEWFEKSESISSSHISK